MYINSMTETGELTYLYKSKDGLGMIAYELERILDDEDHKDLPSKHTKEPYTLNRKENACQTH